MAIQITDEGINIKVVDDGVEKLLPKEGLTIKEGGSNDVWLNVENGKSVRVPLTLVTVPVVADIDALIIAIDAMLNSAPANAGSTSSNNSTTSPLSSGATFTGDWEVVEDYSEITVSYYADQAGAANGLSMEFSPDGVNADRQIQITPPSVGLTADFGGAHTLAVINKYFRIVYTNGGTNQGAFRLQTIYHTSKSKGLTSRTQQVLNKANDVELIRLVSDIRMDRAQGFVGYSANVSLTGTNLAVPNAPTFNPLWTGTDGASSGGAYTWPTAAETVRIKADAVDGSADDTAAGTGAREIKVFGLDANWVEISETIATNGQSASSATSAAFLRVNSVVVTKVGTYQGSNVGAITIENTSSTDVLAIMQPTMGRTDQLIYSVPASKTLYLRQIVVEGSESNTCHVRGRAVQGADDVTGPEYAPAITTNQLQDFGGVFDLDQQNPPKLVEKTDFWLEAHKESGGGTPIITAIVYAELIDD